MQLWHKNAVELCNDMKLKNSARGIETGKFAMMQNYNIIYKNKIEKSVMELKYAKR